MNQVNQKCVMIIAGEASGDLHGAKLVNAMRVMDTNLYFCGIGGPAMVHAGVRVLVDAKDLAVVGFTEVAEKAGTLLKGMMLAKEILRQVRPDLLILIDFPDFNLSVAKVARKLGLKTLYYISPQIWAWRSGRVKKIKKLVDHIAVILPFEKDFYDAHNVPATFVGHPLLDGVKFKAPEKEAGQISKKIGLVPGSRNKEVLRHLKLMLDAALIMKQKIPGLSFVVPVAPTVDKELVNKILESSGFDLSCISLEYGGASKVLEQSALIIAASGTVTLEAAIALVPTVIIYKMSLASYAVAKAVAKVRFAGLANLIADRQIMPELIQGAATPDTISATALEMLENPEKFARIRHDLGKIREELGGAGASKKTAQIAIDLLDRRSK